MRWDILDAVREAAAAAGIPKIDDFNTGDNEGSSYFQVNQKRGRRWSAARGFLKPVLKRPNLRLETGVHVDAIAFEGGRASGVAFTQGRRQAAALRRRGEVILAAGAVASPKILELSGIGDGARLAALGIAARPPCPGRRREPAGPPAAPAGLQGRGRAHAQPRLCQALAARPRWRSNMLLCATGPLTDGALAARRLRANPRRTTRPPISNSISSRSPSTNGARAFTPSAPSPPASATCGPSSRGSVHAVGADPRAAPDDPPELSLDRGGPARRGRRSAPDAPHRRARRRSRATGRRSTGPAREPHDATKS